MCEGKCGKRSQWQAPCDSVFQGFKLVLFYVYCIVIHLLQE